MKKIGIGNYRLPGRTEPGPPVVELLPHDALLELSSIATGQVVKMTLRAIGRAELFEARHPFWNSLARCYVRVIEQFDAMNDLFPGITRVVHNSEILRGDILVSDYTIGLNFGSLDGKTVPLKIRVLEVDGDTVKGAVLQGGDYRNNEVCCFKNEIWFFLSHKFGVLKGSKKKIR
jgi:hypothetical protein